MASHIFTGFGFGAIQGGLFVKEAFQSGNFDRIVVTEIDQILVDAIRANQGSYYVNIAGARGIEVSKIENIELFNPNVPKDKQILAEVLAQSTEITTCLPSVDFYESSQATSPVSLLAQGLKNSKAGGVIIYTAENNNRAAEILEEALLRKIGAPASKKVQFLNTVIGKMSRVVTDPAEIKERKLTTISRGLNRAFLVEEFNRILVTRTRIPDFKPGITVFIEKDDLLPFEEAKLYGHNAIHALLGFIGVLKGYTRMTEIKRDQAIMQIGKEAFLRESGGALIKKYASLGDKLFTEPGFQDYAEDLLERMTNPYLADTINRISRDIVRKLGINERIFGTMKLSLEYGIEPINMALGAMAGTKILLKHARDYNLPPDLSTEKILKLIWKDETSKPHTSSVRGTYTDQLIKYTKNAKKYLRGIVKETYL